MQCAIFCLVGIVFVTAHLIIMFNVDKTQQKKSFYETLTPELVNKYEGIIKERRNISLTGYVIGLVLAFASLIYTKNIKKLNTYNSAFFTAGITLLVNYLYYTISRKSDYMIIHLDKEEQRVEWQKIYRSMQLKYHLGLLLGVIGAGLFGSSICSMKRIF
tara:strand:+ start:55 stop:534 length:480 start_codon:yes stop_codon:yes gene_type:complete